MKLEYNNLPDILEFIKNPNNEDAIFLLECAILEAKKNKYKINDKVIFGRKRGKQHIGLIHEIKDKHAIIKCMAEKRLYTVPYSLMALHGERY